MKSAPPPKDLQTLSQRASMLTDLTLGELSKLVDAKLPRESVHAKGWIGRLLEAVLGAHASSKPLPDFPDLGVELKTLPLNAKAVPCESTFVCHIALAQISQMQWQSSCVYRKLSHVLWIPVKTASTQDFHARRIGQPFFWRPSSEEWEDLRVDWEEAVEIMSLGQWHELNARRGKVLQVRPKGADACALTQAFDEAGNQTLTLPRGFYLRAAFTKKILQQANTQSTMKSDTL